MELQPTGQKVRCLNFEGDPAGVSRVEARAGVKSTRCNVRYIISSGSIQKALSNQDAGFRLFEISDSTPA